MFQTGKDNRDREGDYQRSTVLAAQMPSQSFQEEPQVAAEHREIERGPEPSERGENEDIDAISAPEPPAHPERVYKAPKLLLEWSDIEFTLKVKVKRFRKRERRTILHSQSAYVKPGQVLAIMGPSGSGKTSLLNILAQRVTNFKGKVLANGEPFTKRMKGLLAFVQQDDVLMPNLSVYESLKFAALLRSREKGYKQKMEVVNAVIKELGLEHCRNTKIGRAGISKGVSGGERKRVAIGIELISQPSILFLDEPTTGLDAAAALHVMETIQRVALNGRAVVMTLHQPRSNIYSLFNRLILLSQGHMVYFGDAETAPDYFTRLGYSMPENYNPADFLLDTISVSSKDENEGETMEKDSLRVKHIIESFKPDIRPGGTQISEELRDVDLKKLSRYASNWFVQFFVILTRSVLNIYRDKTLTMARLFQTVFIAVLTGLVFLRLGYNQKDVQNRAGVLFFIMINQSMNTIFAALAMFPEDNAIFLRERGVRAYSASSYYIGKSISELPLAFFYPILFGSITYWMVGLNENASHFFIFLFFLVVISYASQALGEAISAASPNMVISNAVAPLIIVLFLLFAGLYENSSTIPVYLIWVYYISLFHYGYEALFLNEFEGLTFTCAPNLPCQFPTGRAAIDYYGFNTAISNKWLDLAFLAAITAACKLIAYLALALKKPTGA